MYIDQSNKSTLDYPFPTMEAFQAAIHSPRFASDPAFRAEVRTKLQQSPHLMPGPNDMRLYRRFDKEDGVQ